MMEHAKDLAAAFLERHGLAATVTLHFDGACEPKNPGGVATGGWIVREDGAMLLGQCRVFKRGEGATNNYAEWCALGCGLRAILDYRKELSPAIVLKIYGDSQLVINQLNRTWACNKEHLQKLRQRCDAILQELNIPWTAEWIPREQNEEADKLSREAYEEETGKKFPERTRR